MVQGGALAVADENEGAWPGLEHVGKVFRYHQWPDLVVHRSRTHEPACRLDRQIGPVRIVEGDGVLSAILEFDVAAKSARNGLGGRLYLPFGEIAQVGRQGPNGAA